MIEELASRYRACLEHYGIVTCSLPPTGGYTDLPELTYAACLAHHGLLGSVEWMRLEKYDLTSIPAEHLASLVSSVTGSLHIWDVSGFDLVNVLDSVKSEELSINFQSLDSEETQALVRAIESRVETVVLNVNVTIDISTLTSYSGPFDRYRGKLRTLARSRNWKVTKEKYHPKWICFKIQRK